MHTPCVVPYAELEAFFTSVVTAAQARGIPCAITSGMACVHFGVAATTKDCDLLCGPEHSDAFRALISETPLRGTFPKYRSNISPPLDARWMRGGWTSHFTWKTQPEETLLDIFGSAPRGSLPWEIDIQGFYVLSYGFERLIDDARLETAKLIHPGLMKWLPNALGHFIEIQ